MKPPCNPFQVRQTMAGRLRTLLRLTIVVLAFTAGFAFAGKPSYSQEFQEHYPAVGERFNLEGFELEPKSELVSEDRARTILIERTRGDKYAYEEQRCRITVQGAGLKQPGVVTAKGFRVASARWITRKLVLIELQISRAVVIESIYDAEQDLFIYQEARVYDPVAQEPEQERAPAQRAPKTNCG